MFSLKSLLLYIILAVGLGFQSSGVAATFSISGSNGGAGISGCGTAPSYSFTSDTLQNSGLATGIGSPGHCVVGFSARAEDGSVGVSTEFGVDAGSPVSVGESRATASATFEFAITPPAGFTGNEIGISVSTIFSGRLTAEILTTSPFTRSAGGFLEATVDINGQRQATVGPGPINVSDSVSALQELSVTNSQGADESGFRVIDLLLTTPSITIDPSLPVFVTLTLKGRSAISAFGDTAANSKSHSWDSLSFISNGEVFNLPEGFSITSNEANVIDNVWLSAVPLPAGMPLLLSAFGALSLWNRRQKANELTSA